MTGSQRLLEQLKRKHPKDRLGQAHEYTDMAKAEADSDPAKYKTFLDWWDRVPLNPDLRALRIFNDLELQADLESSARSYDLVDE